MLSMTDHRPGDTMHLVHVVPSDQIRGSPGRTGRPVDSVPQRLHESCSSSDEEVWQSIEACFAEQLSQAQVAAEVLVKKV